MLHCAYLKTLFSAFGILVIKTWSFMFDMLPITESKHCSPIEIIYWRRLIIENHDSTIQLNCCYLLTQSKVVIRSLRVHAEKIVQSVVQETLSLFKASCFRVENRQGILRRKRFISSYLCWRQNLCLIFFSVLRKWLFLVSEWAESLNAFCLGNQNWKPDKTYLHF